MVEHRILIPTVAGSNPASPATPSLQWRISSAAEHRIVYPAVGGSIPPCVANYHCIAGAIGRRACLKHKMFSVRIGGDAPHKIVKAPMVESVDTAALKTVAIARSNRAWGTTQFTTVSPSWWNGRHTCLRNRRTSIPSSNLGEGTIHDSRLAQRESGCLTSSGSAVQSRHRLPVFARWSSGPRQLPAKQSNRWFESSSRVHI